MPATDDNLNALGSVYSEPVTHISVGAAAAVTLDGESDWYSTGCIMGDVLVTDRATLMYDVNTIIDESNRSDSSWVNV